MRPLYLLTIVLSGSACGGLPIPTPGASQCAPNVYIEKGAQLSCDTAMLYIGQAYEATGIPLTEAHMVEFMATSLASVTTQYPKAWGITERGDIAVLALHANSVIHEFYHLRDPGAAHCNWSAASRLETFNDWGVAGAFDDACAHLHCESTYMWKDSVTGQVLGNQYVCTPLQ